MGNKPEARVTSGRWIRDARRSQRTSEPEDEVFFFPHLLQQAGGGQLLFVPTCLHQPVRQVANMNQNMLLASIYYLFFSLVHCISLISYNVSHFSSHLEAVSL